MLRSRDLIFKGHLPISYPRGLESFLDLRGTKLKDFKRFALNAAGWLKCHAQLTAERVGRPYEYLNRPVRKEEFARQIAERDRVRRGLICVFGTVEPVQSFSSPLRRATPSTALRLA